MKKLLVLSLSLLLICTCAFSESLTGGWIPSASPEITEEAKSLFDKGLEDLLGVSYVPVAYLGSQLVSGHNHAFLVQATLIYPDAAPYYAVIYLYEDLSGNVSILNIAPFDIGSLCTYGEE